MEKEVVKIVENFIKDSFAGSNHTHTPSHLFDTAECVKLLDPNADSALIVAALGHDIDRAFNDRTKKSDGFRGPIYLKEHQESSANILKEFLEKNNVDQEFIDRVWHLISKHEEGGDKDQNVLRDADSLSFFRNENYVEIIKKYQNIGIKDKIDWMYDRIGSDRAKELAEPYYKKALIYLENE
jgi:hypothetical protein